MFYSIHGLKLLAMYLASGNGIFAIWAEAVLRLELLELCQRIAEQSSPGPNQSPPHFISSVATMRFPARHPFGRHSVSGPFNPCIRQCGETSPVFAKRLQSWPSLFAPRFLLSAMANQLP